MSRVAAVACALAAGGLVALQPPANSLLSRHVGALGATLLSLLVSLAVVGTLLAVSGQAGHLRGIVHYRPAYALGGIAGAVVVLVSLSAVRALGAGGLTALLVLAQLGVSVLADRLGWLGLAKVAISPGRVAGLVLVGAGTVLLTRF